ncbi:IclR family transcriptional regulator [Natrinema versiforme]|uniref:IclR family transcriptional regulator n=1 Tax=Natrinema versiforme TaxID=88724 RepID=A0A4P8WMY4_9EURY|nr:IclR family transcriptional regulator [Natrinema versiforme]QCS44968.1 IclR family transcriptional regulator [Natrinema versiforme]
MGDEKVDEGRRLKSVDQAFDIIEYLREGDSATLTEIATDFGMPMSTAHIHLSTLVENGYVIKEDNEYRCGLRFLRTGGELRDQMTLFQVSKTEIDDLQEKTGEIANIGTMEDGYLVQLYKSESSKSIDDKSPLGSHLHLHSTAMGKAILAHLSTEEIDRAIEKRGMPQLTTNTITERDALEEDLEVVRERGYAINRGEDFSGVCAVASPILSGENEAIGAICISGPRSRIDSERIEEEFAPALSDKKNIIELKIKQYEDR